VYARHLTRLEELELFIDVAFSDTDDSTKLCETVRASVLGKLSVSLLKEDAPNISNGQ
jgi:hypothetical protein